MCATLKEKEMTIRTMESSLLLLQAITLGAAEYRNRTERKEVVTGKLIFSITEFDEDLPVMQASLVELLKQQIAKKKGN